jgi:hypothetical protein
MLAVKTYHIFNPFQNIARSIPIRVKLPRIPVHDPDTIQMKGFAAEISGILIDGAVVPLSCIDYLMA